MLGTRAYRLYLELAALAFAVCAMPAATAQAKPLIIGFDYQETSNTFQLDIGGGACGGEAYCGLFFSRVPLGKYLTITQVSCILIVSAGQLDVVGLVARKGGLQRLETQILVPNPAVGNRVLLNNMTNYLVRQRDTPSIVLNSTQTTDYNGGCTITGRLNSYP